MVANAYGINDLLGAGGAFLDGVDPKWGLKAVLRRIAGRSFDSQADVTALAANPGDATGQRCLVQSDRSTWEWVAGSALTTDIAGGSGLVVAATGGAWVRVDKVVDLKLPIGFATANNAVLWTVPTGFRVKPLNAFWEPTADWTGGTASAIGLSSSNAGANTAGDILGGASGDVAAGLTAAAKFTGTVGAHMAPPAPGLVLVAGDTLKFNRITSAFAAGAGFAHVQVAVVP